MTKRLVFLIIALFLLSACSVSTATQDTTAGIGTGGNKGETAVSFFADKPITATLIDIQCQGFLMPGTNHAQVSFIMEMAEDALKLGGDGPYLLYGGGIVELKDTKAAEERQSFSCVELDTNPSFLLEVSGYKTVSTFVADLSFMVEIEGIRVPVPSASLIGVAGVENDNPGFLLEVSGLHDLVDLTCQGFLMPGSTLARIIMIGELKDGSQFRAGGIMEADQSFWTEFKGDSFECSLAGAGSVVEVTAVSEQPNAFFTSLKIGELQLRPTGDGGNGFLMKDVHILGFNIGMPPS